MRDGIRTEINCSRSSLTVKPTREAREDRDETLVLVSAFMKYRLAPDCQRKRFSIKHSNGGPCTSSETCKSQDLEAQLETGLEESWDPRQDAARAVNNIRAVEDVLHSDEECRAHLLDSVIAGGVPRHNRRDQPPLTV